MGKSQLQIERQKLTLPLLREIKKRLRELANPERAQAALRYFKTGPGQYGEGDRFLGNSVPDLRKLSREYRALEKAEILELLHSPIHEERALALLILNLQFQQGTADQRKTIHGIYLKNHAWINNWDLVDCSAPLIIGEYLLDKDQAILKKLATSNSLWERRTSMVATYAFIRRNRFDVPLRIARSLLKDEEDLIHKATGWMLRELGKRAPDVLENFLDTYASSMPRTALRYAIEKFPEKRRKHYLSLKAQTLRK